MNLGLEYCVFKWPDGVWDKDWEKLTCQALEELDFHPFLFSIYGIQINPDGVLLQEAMRMGQSSK